jgi:hypothetical protein
VFIAPLVRDLEWGKIIVEGTTLIGTRQIRGTL